MILGIKKYIMEERNLSDKWTSKINHWYNIGPKEYEFIFKQAKEKFDDILSENESITSKSIKMATAIVAFAGFYLGIALQNHLFLDHRFLVFTILILLLINLLIIGSIIFPRKGYNKGISPDLITDSDFDNEDDKDYYLAKLYYTAIGILQDKIDNTIILNTERIKTYKIALVVFGSLIFFMSITIVMTV